MKYKLQCEDAFGGWFDSATYFRRYETQEEATRACLYAGESGRMNYRVVGEEHPNVSTDPVEEPPHYTFGGIETIDFIEAKQLDFNLGNVVKYIARAGKKAGSDYLQDLKKARSYLERAIAKKEKNG